jgi:class 3 adenylate cyclase/TolB-like protein/Tfp pilus assembly protein PilF
LSPERVERRLAAILAADVAGYSRLTGIDEEGTHVRLKDHLRSLVDPKIAEHHGRVVKNTGDGLLAEFSSVVEAVRCALDVQRGMVERNADVPQEKRIEFRIGINVGDIIIDGGDIFGDGVNVAARLQSLAQPGGICVSGRVQEDARDKMDVAFEDAGEHRLKNIERPVHTFRVLLTASNESSLSRSFASLGRKPAHALVLAGVLALLAIGGGAAWWWHTARHGVVEPLQTAERSAPGKVRPLSARPTVAVLPFLTLSTEPADDYFGDGLTEDIISALGRFSDLAVLARNAVFPYKGRQLRSQELGRELGARYLVEGSVRRSSEHVRVSVQLADAASGALLWSGQYDSEPKGIFSIQDSITRQITGALAVKLTKQEQMRAVAKPPSNLEAYDLVLRGRALMARLTRTANVEARSLFQRAIAVDPRYAAAYVGLGYAYQTSFVRGWTDQPIETLKRVQNLATTAIGLDGSNPGAHVLLGVAVLQFRQYEQAINELKLALDLNPSDAETYGWLGHVLLFAGALQESITAFETALRFDPNLDRRRLLELGMAYFLLGRTAEATRVVEQSIASDPGFAFGYGILAAIYSEAGRAEDAAGAVAALRKLDPFFYTDSFGSLFRNPDHQARFVTALHKAGL